jgi:16S rRNA (uracil1498-N3)-methyltransferase
MVAPYFFEPGLDATNRHFLLSEESSKHAIQVLRMKPGNEMFITNGRGSKAHAFITVANKKHCSVEIFSNEMQSPEKRELTIAISLLKNASRYEWFLEKATELGINSIIPLISKRTERQHVRMDRLKGIVSAAMLQSQQTWLPELQEPILFEKLIANTTPYTEKYIAHCMEGEKQAITSIITKEKTILLIGPEGDFSPEELALAMEQGYKQVSLGVNRLRTETAGIVAASILRLC